MFLNKIYIFDKFLMIFFYSWVCLWIAMLHQSHGQPLKCNPFFILLHSCLISWPLSLELAAYSGKITVIISYNVNHTNSQLAISICISLIICFSVIIESTPSQSCGPFRGYAHPYDFITTEGNLSDFFLFKPAVPIAGYVFLL